MTRDQQKYLLNRLEGAAWYRRFFRRPSDPAEVAKARRIIERYNDKIEKQENEAQKRHREAYQKAKEAIHFGTEKEALVLIKKVEAIVSADR